MPGHFVRCMVVAASCSVFGACFMVAVPGDAAKTSVENSPISYETTQKGPFGFFKKGPSTVTSVIVSVYNQGKFVGILLIDRGRPPMGPALPGGIVRYKENPKDCVERTLSDECGVFYISNIQQFRVFSDPARDPRMHAVDIAYFVRIDDQRISSGTDAKRVWVCPIDKIPWDKLVFDHRIMLKSYLEYVITSNGAVEQSEKVQLHHVPKKDVRNRIDFENIAKQAYRPPYLFVAGIVEVYENNEFKGIAIADFKLDSKIKLLPVSSVAYGETIEQAFQRRMRENYHAEISILSQFKSYSFLNDTGKKHDITAVFLAQADKKALGTLHVYALNEVPLENLGFHHKDIFEEYLKYRNGEKVDTCAVCIPSKQYVQKLKDTAVKCDGR